MYSLGAVTLTFSSECLLACQPGLRPKAMKNQWSQIAAVRPSAKQFLAGSSRASLEFVSMSQFSCGESCLNYLFLLSLLPVLSLP